jgi:hypothetical protein
MATRRRRHASLGRVYARAPNGCKCAPGQKQLVGRSGVRCMRMFKVGDRLRWLITKTPPICNGKAKKRAKR